MTTLYLEVLSSFIWEIVADGLVVVIDEHTGRHWTGAPKNIAAGDQKARNEKKRPKKQI